MYEIKININGVIKKTKIIVRKIKRNKTEKFCKIYE
jgi:hypothetical protein